MSNNLNKESNSNRIIVLGASGNIGFSTVKALVEKNANVTAGVRDPLKSNLQELKNTSAQVINAHMGLSEIELTEILKNYDTVFVVTPQHEDRVELTLNAIRASKLAKIKYILVVSIPESRNQNLLFGKQYTIIEDELKISGLKYGLLKLPMFMENMLGNTSTIATQNTFSGPIDGSAKYATISVEDSGIAAAEILSNPENHLNKSFLITGDLQSHNEMAKSFSKALNRDIKYINIQLEGFKKIIEPYLQEWQVIGILGLYENIQNGNTELADFSDEFYKLTGKKPLNNEEWMKKHSHLFTIKS